MKRQLLKTANHKIGLIIVGILIFTAGMTVAVDHKTVNLKSADSTQASQPTSSNTTNGQTITSPNNDLTADPSTVAQPDGSSTSPTTDPTAETSSPIQADTVQTPPPVTLVSQRIVNDAVTPTSVPIDPNHQSGTEWVETASCLYTYSDGSTLTKDMGMILEENVAFTATKNGRDCSNL